MDEAIKKKQQENQNREVGSLVPGRYSSQQTECGRNFADETISDELLESPCPCDKDQAKWRKQIKIPIVTR